MIAAATRFPATRSTATRSTARQASRRLDRTCRSTRPQRDCLERLRLSALADTTRFLNRALTRTR